MTEQIEKPRDASSIRYLFLTRNKFPAYRVDIRVLFFEEMTRLGHHIDWLMPSAEPRRRREVRRQENGRVWISAARAGDGAWSRVVQLLQEFANDLRVFSLVRSGEYDFIQVKDKFVSGVLALIASRFSGTKLIFWLAYPFPESWIYDGLSRTSKFPIFSVIRGYLTKLLLYRVLLPNADFVFVQSEQMKRDIAEKGIDPNKMHAVPMGVELEFLNRDLTATRCHPPIIVYVGTMIRIRRLDFLLEVLKRVRVRVPGTKLYMVGGTPEDIAFLAEQAKQLDLASSVVFTGELPREQAMDWMQRATVCVSPFLPIPILNSTSPTKLVEYMSQGTAVVANEHPEQSLVISESGAGLCVPYEEQAFADAITDILTQPELAEEMGNRGRSYVRQERSYRVIADRLNKAYVRILAADR